MLKYKSIQPRYLHTVFIYDLPAHLERWARAWGRDCDDMLDYMDGDYHVLLDFKDVLVDTTPDATVDDVLYGDLSEAAYPFDWTKEAHTFAQYATRKRWLEVTKHIAANLPPDLVAENKVALHISN